MIGIDEVGRGAWAGPLVVAGCYFTSDTAVLAGLDDSKRLTKKQREALVDSIKMSTIHKVVVLDAEIVDRLGLTQCIKNAVLEIMELMPKETEIMLDGKYNFLSGTPYEPRTKVVVGADGLYPAVMAASVLAKVTRDKLMALHDNVHPGYGFAKNVGYGTLEHRNALKTRGVCSLHRRSVAPIKNLEFQ